MTGRHHERQLLDRLVDAVRAGEGQALVVQGVPGVGKTVLLDYLAGHASSSGCRLVKVAGMQSEMELAFAGLHQLCATILSRIDQLPAPQRDALRTAFGVAAGPPPDRLMVGLATLSLLAGMATERPLICVIDDVQWLDQASAQVLGFAARRLAADPVGLVFAVRDPDVHLAGLPELEVGGLRHEDARALLDAALTGPLDARVRDLIVAETRGNPLALLELPRGLTPAEMAGGFGLPGAVALTSRIEGSFKRQLEALPDSARRLLQLAAADPSGDRALVWRAAGRLGIPVRDAVPAVEAGLAEFGVQVRFRHPLLRSAAYLSASIRQRQQIHAALADVTDPQVDPDRRAWHRAHSSAGPDEEVAVELEQSADRAQARGGMSAAAAFLERAVLLTADPARHADRVLVAATACMHAGALDKTLDLLATARPGELDEFQKVQADLLRAHVALASGVDSDASSRLLKAAKGLESFDMELARETYLAAVGATQMAGQHAGWDVLLEISHAVQVLPTPPGGLRPQDLLLDGLTRLAVDGHTAAGPALQRAAAAVADLPVEDVLRWGWMAAGATALLWDFEGMDAIVGRQVELVRSAGALAQLPLHLGQLGITRPWMGDLAGTASVIAEIDSVGAATGSPTPPYTQLRLLALQGDEAEAFMPIADAIKHATEAGQGLAAAWAHWASAVLYNGLARYPEAVSAARQATAFTWNPWMAMWAMPELVEAAARCDEPGLARDALDRLAATTQPSGLDTALGIEARCRALVSAGPAAESLHREAIDRLSRTRLRPDLARAHLLFGEWLRRHARRFEAREQLHTAREMFTGIGMKAFAERARHELLATGEAVRRSTVEIHNSLTAQEAHIARLARDGRTNPEIGTRLFISARTVEWHLRKVFAKLDIKSRRELHSALARLGNEAQPI